MKKYLNSDELLDVLFAYHLANTGERTVENWTKRGNMTKNEAKYLRMSITYTQKFIKELLGRLEPKECEKVAKRTIKAAEKPLIFIDKWMEQRVMGTYYKEMDIVKIDRKRFEKLALISMKAACEDCQGNFNDCPVYDMYEDLLLPRAEQERNCPYAFLSKEKLEERKANLLRLEEERLAKLAAKGKRKAKKHKNKYDEDDEIYEYNFTPKAKR